MYLQENRSKCNEQCFTPDASFTGNLVIGDLFIKCQFSIFVFFIKNVMSLSCMLFLGMRISIEYP